MRFDSARPMARWSFHAAHRASLRAAAVFLAASTAAFIVPDPAWPAPIPVLVFEKRLPTSVEPYGAVDSMFARLAPGLNLTLRFTQDSNLINADSLKPYRIVVWNNVMRNVLSGTQQKAFQAYMERGGGYLGFHAAATNRRLWPWYVDDFLGGDNYAQDHIAWGTSVIYADTVTRAGRTLGAEHAIMKGVPRNAPHYGEWYWWNPNPADNPAITVLQWYQPRPIDKAWPQALPLSWCREVGDGPAKGRMFYTQASHESALYREAWYQAMVANAVRWVAEAGSTGVRGTGTGSSNSLRTSPARVRPTPAWPLPKGGHADASGAALP